MPPQAKALHALAKKRTARPPMDWPLLIIVLTLVGFGLVMLFSSSYPAGYYRFGDSYEFIRPQMFYAAVGIIAMLIISHIDDVYKRQCSAQSVAEGTEVEEGTVIEVTFMDTTNYSD